MEQNLIFNNTPSIYGLSQADIEAIFKELAEPAYRLKQLEDLKYRSTALDIADFSAFSSKLKSELEARLRLFDITMVRQQISKDGTHKYLFQTHDGEYFETVLMKYRHGYSICVSSQVGCKMGCSFCASTQNGFLRNLRAHEMLEQVLYLQKFNKIRISNVVLMGIGEPLDNLTEVMGFIHDLTDENKLGLSQRKITISTCGLVDKIDELAEMGLQINLAVSLHNPFQDERENIMPVARRFALPALVRSIDRYAKLTSRRVSLEYALIEGENSSLDHAKELVRLFQDKLVHVNIIVLNPVEGSKHKKTDRKTALIFSQYLSSHGLPSTLRRTLGEDIDAACGQLRNKTK